MPRAPRPGCSAFPCSGRATASSSLCYAHLAESRRAYDAQRPTAAQRGYGWEWQDYRDEYLAVHTTCVTCGAPSTLVDHIVAVKQGGSFWDPDNHQALCRSCHGTKTSRERVG